MFEIKYCERVSGMGAYSLNNYEENTIIYELKGSISNSPTRESIHIGNNKHVIDEFGQYINHSFDPNVKIVNNFLLTIKKINIGDEITFDYNDSEINMKNPFYVDDVLVCGHEKSALC